MNETDDQLKPPSISEEVNQQPQQPEPLSKLQIPDRKDPKAVLEFLRRETLAQLKAITEQYPDIMIEIDQKIREIPNKYKYHKTHMISYYTNPAYHIVRLILYDRYIAKTTQFPQSRDPQFLAFAVFIAKAHDVEIAKENHEKASAIIARELMLKHDFMTDKIADGEEAILSTEFTNIGKDLDEEKVKSNPLIAFMMDADTANFGEEGDNEFMTNLVAEELGRDPNDPEFLESTLQLMKKHQYYTEAAKYFFSEQKAKNIQALEERITTLQAQGGQPPAENN